jgi:hypothetical protein
MEDDLKISQVEYLSNQLWDPTKMLNFKCRRPLLEDDLKVEHCKHLLYQTQILYDQTIFHKWRQPPMEDDLKISKLEYLSNRLYDHTQILNLDLGDQSKVFKYFNEDNNPWKTTSKLKLKVEYISNHLLDLTQILNLSLDDQIILYKFFKWRRPSMEDDLQLMTTSKY